MADAHNHNRENFVPNVVHNAMNAYANAKEGAATVYTLTTWGMRLHSQTVDATSDSCLLLSREVFKLFQRSRCKLDLVRHHLQV